MTVDLSILNDTISAFMTVGQTIIDNTDVLVGLAIIGVIIYIAKKLGNGFGDMFMNLTKGQEKKKN